ncbi:MAG: lytic transglycosylase [Deltaproteobacteria bacterium HGW-Deltaproteobacteria-19]|nr:MAG: lytic transglycosylase [Deltaproteobacteria bacterium HGW-Deltaproteobacteria-19]
MPITKHILRGAIMTLALLMILPALPGDVAADIYKYVDETGIIHLTNVPTDVNKKYTLIMKEKRVLFNRNIARDIKKFDVLITKSAEKHGMDPALIKAVIKAESNFNHQAVSPKGARGLMQLMPATASSLHVDDSFHPEKNIDGGVRYLRYLIRLFNGDLRLALAAYNAGEKAVQRYGGIPPYRETQQYVQRVLAYLDGYRR